MPFTGRQFVDAVLSMSTCNWFQKVAVSAESAQRRSYYCWGGRSHPKSTWHSQVAENSHKGASFVHTLQRFQSAAIYHIFYDLWYHIIFGLWASMSCNISLRSKSHPIVTAKALAEYNV